MATGLDTVGFSLVVVGVSPAAAPDEAFTAPCARIEVPAGEQGLAHTSHSGRRAVCSKVDTMFNVTLSPPGQFWIKIGNESCFNVSLTVRGKVTIRRCP